MTLTPENRWSVSPEAARRFDTAELRRQFLVEGLFAEGGARLVYSHDDRMIVGGVRPGAAPVTIDKVEGTGAASLLDRREAVIVCVAGPGTVSAGPESHAMEKGDMLYLGMGSGPLAFSGAEARFYLLSAPAHRTCPTRLVRIGEAKRIDLGARETSNERSIFQFVHPDVMESCQLVVGMTKLRTGSVWNTIPPHVHSRRSEVYLYLDLPDEHRVLHLMGEPGETRHLVVRNEEAVLSPPWSIHAGAGTASYSFVWAMVGDNVDYRDVDPVGLAELL